MYKATMYIYTFSGLLIFSNCIWITSIVQWRHSLDLKYSRFFSLCFSMEHFWFWISVLLTCMSGLSFTWTTLTFVQQNYGYCDFSFHQALKVVNFSQGIVLHLNLAVLFQITVEVVKVIVYPTCSLKWLYLHTNICIIWLTNILYLMYQVSY